MKLVGKIEQFLFAAPRARLIIAGFLITLIKTGIWAMPNISLSRAVAQNPFQDPLQNSPAEYLLTNWLGPFVTWLLHLNGETGFFLFHLACAAAFCAVMLQVIFHRLTEENARKALLLFLMLPVSATAYFWVGMDGLTLLLLGAALAASTRPLLLLPIGFLLGLQHFEQGMAASLILLGALLARGPGAAIMPRAWRMPCCLGAGLIAGKILLTLLFYHWRMGSSAAASGLGRVLWLQIHAASQRRQFLLHAPSLLWSLLGCGWLAVLKYADSGQSRRVFFAGLLLACLLLFTASDQTRVFAIASLPLLSLFLLFDGNFLATISRRETAFAALLWLLLPWSWSWVGRPQWSAFPYDVAYITSLEPSDNLANWPFH